MENPQGLVSRLRAKVKHELEKRNLLDTYRRVRSFGAKTLFNHGFEKMYKEIDALPETGERNAIIFTGIITTPKKPTLYPFLTRLKEAAPDLRIVTLDEGRFRAPKELPVERVHFPYSLNRGEYFANRWMEPGKHDADLVARYPMIEELTDHLMDRQMDIGRSGIRRLICAYAEAYERAIERVQPKAVIMWCEFTKMHPLFAKIAQEHGAKVLFWEYGSIPGTFAIEDQGQMGESRIATEWESFLAKDVTEEEKAKAGEILDFLRGSGLNRNVQTEVEALGDLEAGIDPKKPLIVFAGQNDFDSGIMPWDEHAKTFHSPCFPDSLTTARYLFDMCKEEGWEFAYKPHPFQMRRTPWDDLPVIRRCNFNAMMDRADVVVTGVSQSSYVACIRKRPCVTVGFNQLKHKGCTYEVTDKAQLRDTLKEALEKGNTPQQQEAFRTHVAQLLKYALFDDLGNRDIRYGRSVEEAAAWLLKEMGV